MEKHLKKFKIKAQDPGLLAKIVSNAEAEFGKKSVLDNILFTRIYWGALTAILLLLILASISINRSHDNLMVSKYYACNSEECKLEVEIYARAMSAGNLEAFHKRKG